MSQCAVRRGREAEFFPKGVARVSAKDANRIRERTTSAELAAPLTTRKRASYFLFTPAFAVVFGHVSFGPRLPKPRKSDFRVGHRRRKEPAQIRVTCDRGFLNCNDSHNFATECGSIAGFLRPAPSGRSGLAPNQACFSPCQRDGQGLALFRYLRGGLK